MLVSLHVKNLALMEEAEVEFGNGLNILSGETGAGKSIIIGSINLALGEKVPKEMLREHAEYALVELIFRVENEEQRKLLAELDIYPENDEIIMSRKITSSRSIGKRKRSDRTIRTIRRFWKKSSRRFLRERAESGSCLFWSMRYRR